MLTLWQKRLQMTYELHLYLTSAVKCTHCSYNKKSLDGSHPLWLTERTAFFFFFLKSASLHAWQPFHSSLCWIPTQAHLFLLNEVHLEDENLTTTYTIHSFACTPLLWSTCGMTRHMSLSDWYLKSASAEGMGEYVTTQCRIMLISKAADGETPAKSHSHWQHLFFW